MVAISDLDAYSNALCTLWDVRRRVRDQIADSDVTENTGIDVASLVVLNALRKKPLISRKEVLRSTRIDSHYICKLLRKLINVGYIQIERVRGNGTDPHYAITETGIKCLNTLIK